jgi:hypothetical protein
VSTKGTSKEEAPRLLLVYTGALNLGVGPGGGKVETEGAETELMVDGRTFPSISKALCSDASIRKEKRTYSISWIQEASGNVAERYH